MFMRFTAAAAGLLATVVAGCAWKPRIARSGLVSLLTAARSFTHPLAYPRRP